MVVLAGQVIEGAVLSFTVIVALQVDVLPQSSVALQIRVFTTGQEPLGVVLTTTTSTVASQASLAVALPHTTAAGHAMVVLAGQVIDGAVLSFTVIVALQVDVLPQSSVALQILVFTTGQEPLGVVLTTVTVTLVSQASLAVALPHTTAAGHAMVVLAGQVIDGAVLSFTVIVALQVDVLPQSSVALQIRVFTTGQEPLGVVLTTTTSTVASQASDAVALPHTTAAGQSIVVLAGQVIDGAVLSFTVIVALQVDVLPQSSVALQILVFTTGQEPLGVVLTTVTVTLVSQASLAVALPHTTTAGHAMVVLAGQVIDGAVLSFTVMVALQVDVLPQSSVALQILVFTTGQEPLGVVLTTVTVTLVSQASDAVALPHTTAAGQSIVVLAGQ
jgi:uncharacterized protein YeaC (DUF1315 family)